MNRLNAILIFSLALTPATAFAKNIPSPNHLDTNFIGYVDDQKEEILLTLCDFNKCDSTIISPYMSEQIKLTHFKVNNAIFTKSKKTLLNTHLEKLLGDSKNTLPGGSFPFTYLGIIFRINPVKTRSEAVKKIELLSASYEKNFNSTYSFEALAQLAKDTDRLRLPAENYKFFRVIYRSVAKLYQDFQQHKHF